MVALTALHHKWVFSFRDGKRLIIVHAHKTSLHLQTKLEEPPATNVKVGAWPQCEKLGPKILTLQIHVLSETGYLATLALLTSCPHTESGE